MELYSRQRGFSPTRFPQVFFDCLAESSPFPTRGAMAEDLTRGTYPGACSMTAPQQQKLKATGPVVVTANRLWDGAVVYRPPDGNWSTRFEQAAVVAPAQAATALLAGSAADDIAAVGAYVAPVRIDRDGHPEPGNLRETIRQS